MAACSGSSDSSFAASSYLAPHRHFGHFARTFLAGVSQGPQLVSSTSYHMHVRGWGSLLSEASWTAREIRRLFFQSPPYSVPEAHSLHFSSEDRRMRCPSRVAKLAKIGRVPLIHPLAFWRGIRREKAPFTGSTLAARPFQVASRGLKMRGRLTRREAR